MQNNVQSESRGEKQPEKNPRFVEVKIDSNPVQIVADTYPIPQLKALLGVPVDYELELVKGGKFHPLSDGDAYKVHGHEEFISHVHCGGSS